MSLQTLSLISFTNSVIDLSLSKSGIGEKNSLLTFQMIKK